MSETTAKHLYQHCCGCDFISRQDCEGCFCHDLYRRGAPMKGATAVLVTDRERRLEAALEDARHELATLHGLVVCDGEAPEEKWSIDCAGVLAKIDDALG